MFLSKRHYLLIGGTLLLAVAPAARAVAMWCSDPVTFPDHITIHVILDQIVAISEKSGHHFRATVSKPVVIEGKTVIPKGARVEGVIVKAKEAGRIKGRAQLQLTL